MWPYFFPSPATQALGLTVSQGSILGAIFNLGGGLGRPAIGYSSNSFGPLNTAAVCTFLADRFSLVIWIFAKSFGVLIFYALVGGVVAPTFTTTVAPVAVEVVGLQVLPSALSILRLSVVMPSTFAEPIALWLRTDNETNFLRAQIFTGFMYMGAAICLWLVRAWKMSDLELLKTGTEAEIREDDAVVARTVRKSSYFHPSWSEDEDIFQKCQANAPRNIQGHFGDQTFFWFIIIKLILS
ncbi:hypothetical protein CNMCM8927_005090 [Aspergillus lentulus]|uniref:Major facilitator superfamily (MFS) profile domain-containing protein n=1 Tax=Aspergillus lentulus TaxID=293939 RepID=A0AAN5YF86_ASPLE|nr:hypothetical protein CNMCM8927_005090 [Aspergillus lentulus]